MMESFVERVKQRAGQVKEYWGKQSLNRKVLFAGLLLLGLLALIILLFATGQKDPYEVLYAELDEKDASAVVARLEEEKITYKLVDNGTTILVRPEYKDSTRLKLAGENLPRGEAGFELFQESSFGETQTDKQIKYQAALQGELARTIQSLDKVKAAKVNLALAEPTLFTENEELPKASVVIRTVEGKKLSPEEINGILNLVANSVDRLETDNVVIIDQDGNLISEDLSSLYANVTDTIKMQMALKNEYEKEKQEAIQTMLDKSLGENNSVVRVNVELDFNNREQVDTRFTHDPDGPFVRSEDVSKESGTETTINPANVPGTDTNIPEYLEVDEEGAVSTWDKSHIIRNYEINETQTVTDFSQGDVKYDYLTVAVFVNNAGTQQANLGDTEEEKITKIRNIVASACGLRENRDNESVRLEDHVSVAFIDFYTEPEPEPVIPGTMDKILSSPYIPWVVVLLALIIIVLAFLLYRRRERTRRELEEEMARQAELEAVAHEDVDVADLIETSLSPEEQERRRVREEIDKIIEESPETAAQVLKAWLLED
jgi:flagellar M-ring protein FliF